MEKLIVFFALFLTISFASAQTWITNPVNGHQYSEIPLDLYSGWLGAESVAVLWGGHLVTINDFEENVWIKATFGLIGGSDQFCWMGLYELQPWGQSIRNWAWSSGEALVYTNWGSGEHESMSEHFVAMDGDGWWRDLSEGNWQLPTRQIAVVELAPAQAVPEPSPFIIVAASLVAFWIVSRFINKRRGRGGGVDV